MRVRGGSKLGASGSGSSRGELRDTPPIVSAIFTTDDGLPDGEISDLQVDRGGRLWVDVTVAASRAWTIRRRTRPELSWRSAVQGLSSNRVTAITDDLYGRIYVATGRGLDRLSARYGTGKAFHQRRRPSTRGGLRGVS